MTSPRRCSRSGCGRPAVATLTYVYSDSTAVVGPLATSAEPHSYDLCEEHAVRLTVPRGWEVLRHVGEFPAPVVQTDDLEALADAVREAARVEVVVPASGDPRDPRGAVLSRPPAGRAPVRSAGSPTGPGGSTAAPARGAPGAASRRGHLRVVPTSAE